MSLEGASANHRPNSSENGFGFQDGWTRDSAPRGSAYTGTLPWHSLGSALVGIMKTDTSVTIVIQFELTKNIAHLFMLPADFRWAASVYFCCLVLFRARERRATPAIGRFKFPADVLVAQDVRCTSLCVLICHIRAKTVAVMWQKDGRVFLKPSQAP